MKEKIQIRSYNFSIKIIQFCQKMPNDKIFWIIGKQLLKSGTSIGANIIEAKAASSKKDFINFYHISLKSANETIYWLGLLQDSIDYQKEDVNYLLNEVKNISNIIGSCIISLKRRNN